MAYLGQKVRQAMLMHAVLVVTTLKETEGYENVQVVVRKVALVYLYVPMYVIILHPPSQFRPFQVTWG